MFNYRCPSCGKHHTVEKNFEQPFESHCLRCGVRISVTEELIHQTNLPARSSPMLPKREEAIIPSPTDSSIRTAVRTVATATEETTLQGDDSGESAAENRRDENRKPAAKKTPKELKKKLSRRAEEEDEASAEEEILAERKPSPPPAKTASAVKPKRPRWQLIAAVAAVLLVLGSTGGYLLFGGKKAEPKKTAAPARKPSKPAPKPAPQVVKKEDPAPPPKIADRADLVVSAAHLSSDLATNADLANNKYQDKILDVSGVFLKIEKKDGLRPPPRAYAVFATSGEPICCDTEGGPTPHAAWAQLKPDQMFTMRGRYEKNGYLRECYLLPQYVSTADKLYQGKTIQVTGRIARIDPPTPAQPFPSIVFEGETNSVLELRFLFRSTDAAEIERVQRGSMLTIQGECNGYQKVEGVAFIRIDNCAFVYTSAAPSGTLRLDAMRLLREYEEDSRKFYLPLPGEEELLDTKWSIRELFKTWSSDSKAFFKKYGNRILRVRGKELRRGDRTLILTAGDTDLTFQIDCRFTGAGFEALRGRHETEYRIRGLFLGQIDGRGLRLENCQLDMPRTKEPVIGNNFLPFKPGRTFTIDIAQLDSKQSRNAMNLVRREVHIQVRDGGTEVSVTHAASLPGKSLFEKGIQDQWVLQPKAAKKIPNPGGIYYQRAKAGFLELGTPYINAQGKADILWAPVLKFGARAGEKWEWDPSNGLHEYEIEKIEKYNDHLCAFVREYITLPTDLHPVEILHVYAQEMGEIERQQWRHIDQRGTKILFSEMKWVEKSARSRTAVPGKSPPADRPIRTPAK